MSTGIAKLDEIERAISICRAQGNDQIILLKCTSAYPAPYSEINLKTMANMGEVFGVQVGLSDHTKGIAVPAAATALGAKLIEKHFILDRNLGGHDAEFSLDVDEFSVMVESVRNVEMALGKVTYDLSPLVNQSRKFGRSLFAVADIKQGEEFNHQNIRCIRPGNGLAPKFMNNLLGKCASSNIESGTHSVGILLVEMSKFNHIEVINKIWFKRRDIISDGFDSSLLALKDFCPDINIHKYPTGSKVWTWTIPPKWEVKEAWIKANGKKIVDIHDHPLHVMSYSMPVSKKISHDELMKFIYTIPENPEGIPFEFSYYRENGDSVYSIISCLILIMMSTKY